MADPVEGTDVTDRIRQTWPPRGAAPEDIPTLCAYCARPSLDGAPVGVCGRHLRILYSYAQDMVNDGWRDAVVEYVSTLEPKARRPVTLREPLGNGVVYFVRIGDVIKIGFTTRFRQRMHTLMPDEVLHHQPGTLAHERQLHAAFAHLRVRGERFRPGPDLLAFIAALKDQEAAPAA